MTRRERERERQRRTTDDRRPESDGLMTDDKARRLLVRVEVPLAEVR